MLVSSFCFLIFSAEERPVSAVTRSVSEVFLLSSSDTREVSADLRADSEATLSASAVLLPVSESFLTCSLASRVPLAEFGPG